KEVGPAETGPGNIRSFVAFFSPSWTGGLFPKRQYRPTIRLETLNWLRDHKSPWYERSLSGLNNRNPNDDTAHATRCAETCEMRRLDAVLPCASTLEYAGSAVLPWDNTAHTVPSGDWRVGYPTIQIEWAEYG